MQQRLRCMDCPRHAFQSTVQGHLHDSIPSDYVGRESPGCVTHGEKLAAYGLSLTVR